MSLSFIENYPDNIDKPQIWEETFYRRRLKSDSELDIHKSIKDQFNLLRIADNEKYPAFFVLNGNKYLLKIYKEIND